MRLAITLLVLSITGVARAAVDGGPGGARISGIEVRVARSGPVLGATLRYQLALDGGSEPIALQLPRDGAVIAMRLVVDGQALPGTLDDVELLEARWLALRSRGNGSPRPIALLQWNDTGMVDLSTAFFSPGHTTSLELDVIAPVPASREAGGLWVTTVPCSRPGDVTGMPGEGLMVGRVVGERYPEEVVDQARSDRSPPSASLGTCALAWPPSLAQGVGLRWATQALPSGEGVIDLELAGGQVIEPAPTGARVVFVIDSSWSQAEAGVAAQLELLRATVKAFPSPKVAVLSVSRRVRTVTGGFVPVAQLDQSLAQGAAALTPENGTEPLLGLQAAARLLRGQRGPARIILFTDRHLPQAFVPEALVAALPRGTIVHVVERTDSGGSPELQRLDLDGPAGDFGPLVAASGGQLVRARGPAGAELDRVAVGLARPVRVDGLRLEHDGQGTLELEPVLDERSGQRIFERVAGLPTEVRVTGWIWGRPIVLAPGQDATLAGAMPALVVGSGLAGDDATTLGLTHGVLAPATAMLAAPAGAEPSGKSEPLLAGRIHRGEYGTSSHCGCCPTRSTRVAQLALDQAAYQRQLAPALAACAAPQSSVRIELGLGEVLAVHAVGAGDRTRCVEEAVWAQRPPYAAPAVITVLL